MSTATWRAPMLATLTDRCFSDEDWIFERKLDGVRALCVHDGTGAELWSRNHKPMGASYPELVDALNRERDFVVDGEIVAFSGALTSFATLQPRIHLTDPARIRASDVQVYLYLFDVLVLDGEDVSARELRERKRLLADAFDFADPLRYSSHRNTDGETYFEQACAKGWEGLIAKRAASSYHSGRTDDWLKFKCVKDQEFVVGGFTDPEGSRVGFGALLLGYYDSGTFRYAGKVGTGYDQRTLHRLRGELDALAAQESPFAERVREPHPHWVRPEMVVQVGFSEWTRDGKLRHPRFTGVRHDKDAENVVRETP